MKLCRLALGLGGGLCFMSLTMAVQHAVPKRDLGMATSSMTFLNALLGAAGVALFGAILAARLSGYLNAHAPAHQAAADILQALDLRRETPALVAAAYRYAVGGAFLISAVMNIATVLAVLKIPPANMRDVPTNARP